MNDLQFQPLVFLPLRSPRLRLSIMSATLMAGYICLGFLQRAPDGKVSLDQ